MQAVLTCTQTVSTCLSKGQLKCNAMHRHAGKFAGYEHHERYIAHPLMQAKVLVRVASHGRTVPSTQIKLVANCQNMLGICSKPVSHSMSVPANCTCAKRCVQVMHGTALCGTPCGQNRKSVVLSYDHELTLHAAAKLGGWRLDHDDHHCR